MQNEKCGNSEQFLEVDGKPIIIYTLQNMLKVDRFDYIYIATHKDYLRI